MKTIRITTLALLLMGVLSLQGNAQSMSKKYQTVVVELQIDAPADRVWEAMVLDYGEISNFSPYIFTSNYERGSLRGDLNAERKCSFNAKGTRWTHEKIAEIDHEQRIMKNVVIDAAKFPLNTDNSFAYYRVKDNGDGTATAGYEFRYRTKPGFMTGMVKGQFKKLMKGTLVGLKHYVETGEVVNATTGNWKKIRKQHKKDSE